MAEEYSPERMREAAKLVERAIAEYPLPTTAEREEIERKMAENDVDMAEQHRLEALVSPAQRDEIWRMRKMAFDGWDGGKGVAFESIILTPEDVQRSN